MTKKFQKILAIVMASVLLVCSMPFMVGAQEYSEPDNMYYEIMEDGNVKITGYMEELYGDLIIPDSIDGKSVTEIGEGAFADCVNVTSVMIPASIEKIGKGVFDDFYSLESITVDPENKNYSSDDFGVLFDKEKTVIIKCPAENAEESYTIPDGVETIGDGAFLECVNLTEITIPDSVTSIGNRAFMTCVSITEITIPDSVTSIGDRAFYSCDCLENITIPAGVETIGTEVFTYCVALTDITVSEENEYYSSDDCGVLFDKAKTVLIQYPTGNESESYTIPDGVKTIDGYAFHFQGYLTDVTIPESVETIADNAFNNSYTLTSITIPGSVKTIGNNAFRMCESLESVTIENGVKSIGEFAFTWSTNLTSAKIAGSVETIGSCAFEGCGSLTDVIIENGVKTIGWYAFKECNSLTDVTIPESVENIYGQAFYTTALNKIVINSPDCYIDADWGTIYERATIYGYEGSTAQAWANEHGRTFCVIEKYIPSQIVRDEESGIEITYDANSLNGNVEIEVVKNLTAAQLLDNEYDRTAAWDITVKVDGKQVQPSAPVHVKILMPDGFYRPHVVAVYHINPSTGKPEKMTITNINSNYMEFDTQTLGTFVIVDESTMHYDPTADCTHMCHKDGFIGFIWKIINFFNKLFRTNQICSCGASHWQSSLSGEINLPC